MTIKYIVKKKLSTKLFLWKYQIKTKMKFFCGFFYLFILKMSYNIDFIVSRKKNFQIKAEFFFSKVSY